MERPFEFFIRYYLLQLSLFIMYLLLLGIAFRVPAKLQNGHDDGHCQTAQEDNKHAAYCRFADAEIFPA